MRRPLAASLVLALLALPAGAREPETTAEWIEWTRRQAEEFDRRGRWDQAAEEWLAVAELDPDAVEPCSKAAVSAVEAATASRERLDKESLRYKLAEYAIRIGVLRGGGPAEDGSHEGDPGLAYAIGRLRLADGEWGTASRMLDQAARGGFDPERARAWHFIATVNRAAELIRNRYLDQAIADLERILEDPPERVSPTDVAAARINLAEGFRRRSEHVQAERMLVELIEREPGLAAAHKLLGIVYGDQGRLEDALQEFNLAIEHAELGSDIVPESLLGKVDTLVKLRRLDEADAALDQLLDLRRDDPDGLYYRALVLQERGRPREALRVYRRIIRMAPDSRDTLLKLRTVLYELEEHDEARKIQARIEELDAERRAEMERMMAGQDRRPDEAEEAPGDAPESPAPGAGSEGD